MRHALLLIFLLLQSHNACSNPAKVGGIFLEGEWKGIKAGEACGAVAGLRNFDAIVILGEGPLPCSLIRGVSCQCQRG